MIRTTLTLLLLLSLGTEAGGSVEAIPSTNQKTDARIESGACDLPEPDHAHPSIEWNKNTICFLYEKHPPEREYPYFVPPDNVALYIKPASGAVKRIREFSKTATQETIHDAFISPTTGVSMRLFVIHSNNSPSRLASVTGLYDVSVFELSENNLTYNKKASDLFGLSGDYVNEQEELFHIYPYKTRESVQAMIDSHLFELADTTTSLNGRIKRKTYLHRDTPTSDSLEKTPSYLIENDKVKIKNTSIGWCQITFSSKTKSTTAWIKCSDIDIHEPRMDAAKNKGEPTGSPPLHSTTPTG